MTRLRRKESYGSCDFFPASIRFIGTWETTLFTTHRWLPWKPRALQIRAGVLDRPGLTAFTRMPGVPPIPPDGPRERTQRRLCGRITPCLWYADFAARKYH